MSLFKHQKVLICCVMYKVNVIHICAYEVLKSKLPAKTLLRNYSKSRSGSSGELRCADEMVNDAMTEGCSDINGNDQPIVNDDDYEVKFIATAVRDCVPSPYDQEALPFRKGDTIMVIRLLLSLTGIIILSTNSCNTAWRFT